MFDVLLQGFEAHEGNLRIWNFTKHTLEPTKMFLFIFLLRQKVNHSSGLALCDARLKVPAFVLQAHSSRRRLSSRVNEGLAFSKLMTAPHNGK